jgi:hypothetical protein
VIAPESVLIESIAHPLECRPCESGGVAPSGARELQRVVRGITAHDCRHALFAQRLADRSRLELLEILHDRLYRALHLARSLEPLLGVFALTLQLRVPAQGQCADDREDRDGDQQLEQGEPGALWLAGHSSSSGVG